MKINAYTSLPRVSESVSADDRRVNGAYRSGNSATVSISGQVHELEQFQEMLSSHEEIRQDKVESAKLSLLDGSLDNDASIDQMLDRLIPDLF